MWLVGTRQLPLTLRLHVAEQSRDIVLDQGQCQIVPVGRQAFIHLIDIPLDEALPQDALIGYDLLIDGRGIAHWAAHLLYCDAQSPSFVLHSRIHQLVHGSCRKPHHPADEGLLCVDRLLADATDRGPTPGIVDDERRPGVCRRCRRADAAGDSWADRAPGAVRRIPGWRRGGRQRQPLRASRQLLPAGRTAPRAGQQRDLARALLRRREKADFHQQHRRQSPSDLCRSDGHVFVGLVPHSLDADRATAAATERRRATALCPRTGADRSLPQRPARRRAGVCPSVHV